MSDAQIGMAIGTLSQPELATIVANTLLSKFKLDTQYGLLFKAIIETAREAELGTWVRTTVKAQLDANVPLNKALRNIAAAHGGSVDIVAALEKRLVEAARKAP